jgi:hypothetical protein
VDTGVYVGADAVPTGLQVVLLLQLSQAQLIVGAGEPVHVPGT